MNLSGLFGGGPPGPQGGNLNSPYAGNDYNPWDPASYMGGYGDPLQQAQNTVSPPSNIDPSTGAPTTPGGGTQSGAPQQPIAQALLQTLNPNMRMQAGAGGSDIRRGGAPVQGASWIQPTPQSTPNPMFPQWTSPMDPSASGSPSYAGAAGGYTPAARPPGRTPTMQGDQPPVPLPRPRPAEADAGDPSTSADVSLQGAGAEEPLAPGTGGLGGPVGPEGPIPNLSLADPNSPRYIPPSHVTADPTQRTTGANVADTPQGGGASGSWTDQPQPPQSSEVGRALGGTTQDPGTTAPAQPPAPAPSPSPVATIPRDPTMQAGDGQPQAGQPPTPEQYRQQYNPQSGMVPPDQYEQMYNQRFGQGGQGGMPFNPIQMLLDFLFGGPQAFGQDLRGLSRQVPGGYNYGDQGDYDSQPVNINPITGHPYNPARRGDLAPEERAPRDTISPQSPKISGEKGPTPVRTSREPGPATATGTVPANTMPTTPGGRLDPFSTAAAGGGGIQGGGPFATATGTSGASRPLVANAPASDVSNPANQPSYDRALVMIESSGKPGQRTGSNRGLGQFSPDLEARYGLNASNRDDPVAVSRALAQERRDHRPGLVRALGREPTAAEYYIAHQQGIAGGPALLQAAQNNPNAPAWQVLRPFYRNPNIAASAIRGNIPRDSPLRATPVSQVTAKQFTDMWKQRYNREVARASGGRVQSFGQGEFGPSPEGNLAMSGYEHMPRWGQGPYGQFRRSPDVIDRRMENSMSSDLGIDALDAMNWARPQSGEQPFSFQNTPSPMANQLGAGDLDRELQRRRSLIMKQ